MLEETIKSIVMDPLGTYRGWYRVTHLTSCILHIALGVYWLIQVRNSQEDRAGYADKPQIPSSAAIEMQKIRYRSRELGPLRPAVGTDREFIPTHSLCLGNRGAVTATLSNGDQAIDGSPFLETPIVRQWL